MPRFTRLIQGHVARHFGAAAGQQAGYFSLAEGKGNVTRGKTEVRSTRLPQQRRLGGGGGSQAYAASGRVRCSPVAQDLECCGLLFFPPPNASHRARSNACYAGRGRRAAAQIQITRSTSERPKTPPPARPRTSKRGAPPPTRPGGPATSRRLGTQTRLRRRADRRRGVAPCSLGGKGVRSDGGASGGVLAPIGWSRFWFERYGG